MNILYTNPSSIDGRNIIIKNEEDIHHLITVLRMKIGEKIKVSDGAGWEYEAILKDIERNQLIMAITDKQKAAVEPSVKITLFQGIPKSQKMELIIQKNVELGVVAITPVFMERTIVVDKGNFHKKITRWQKISDEAVKQCARGFLPEITEPISFEQMVGALDDFDLVIFPYENAKDISIKDILKNFNGKTLAIIIGPEGGFSSKEVAALEALGIEGVTLGKTVLRTETAGMVAVAMCMYELEL